MTIYVVFGTTGDSDRSEWPVKAYRTEADAKACVEKATELANAWREKTQSDEFDQLSWSAQEELRKNAVPLDPHFDMDYTGTSYFYYEVELEASFTYPEAIQ